MRCPHCGLHALPFSEWFAGALARGVAPRAGLCCSQCRQPLAAAGLDARTRTTVALMWLLAGALAIVMVFPSPLDLRERTVLTDRRP